MRPDLYGVRRQCVLDALEDEDRAQVLASKVNLYAASLVDGDTKSKTFTAYAKSLFPYWHYAEEDETDVEPQNVRESFVQRFKVLQEKGELPK